jgi:small-conductance mechanosensitive channel/CRP-like cAMP-binding protein
MSGWFRQLFGAIEPLLPGLVLAGLFILFIVGARVALRGEKRLTDRLRVPAVLLWLYVFTMGLVVGAAIYWQRVVSVLYAIGLLILALAIILAVAFALFDLFFGRYRKVEVPRILRDLLVVVVYVVAIFVILGQYAKNLAGVLTTSAVLTAVIGLALQDLLSNFISGLALQIERPFKSGDWVKFGEQEGAILEVNWRSTKIETLHSDIVIVPNNVITKSSLINMSVPTTLHRRRLTIGLRYEAPPNRAKASILKAVRSVEGVLDDPEPFVLLRSYDDFSIAYRLHFFIDELHLKERIEDRVFTRLWYQLKRDGLSIPFPIRDVNITHVGDDDEQRQQERELSRVVVSLEKVRFLEPLSPEETRKLAGSIRRVFFGRGERIIRQGDEGDSFYIIATGAVDVLVGDEQRRVASLGRDDYFGEMSLMTGEKRSATVVATADTECYVVNKAAFEQLINNNEALVEQISQALEQRQRSLAASNQPAGTSEAEVAKAADGLASRIRRFFGMRRR